MGAHCRNLANTIEAFVHGGGGALCLITLTTWYSLFNARLLHKSYATMRRVHSHRLCQRLLIEFFACATGLMEVLFWPVSVTLYVWPFGSRITETRMWANAQRDGRPAEYRWRPVFNNAKFGWRPLLECRPVTLLRRQTGWNLQGCPKLTKRSQPLVGRSSPYYGDICKRYCCLTSFFRLSIHALVAKI